MGFLLSDHRAGLAADSKPAAEPRRGRYFSGDSDPHHLFHPAVHRIVHPAECLLTSALSVIPGRRAAKRSGEPGIHNHKTGVMDSTLSASAALRPRPE